MEVMLERVISLIPKKPDGKFVHGAKKEFSKNIGAPENIVSDWISGRSSSYKNYAYQISAKYGVSVEWLKGETDEKIPPPKGDGMQEIEAIFSELIPSRRAKLLELARLYLDDQRRNEET